MRDGAREILIPMIADVVRAIDLDGAPGRHRADRRAARLLSHARPRRHDLPGVLRVRRWPSASRSARARPACSQVSLVDLREYTHDRHRTTDDTPYGGGHGMVMKVAPIVEALEAIATAAPRAHRVLLSPRGAALDHRKVDGARRASRIWCWSAGATRASTSASATSSTRSSRSATTCSRAASRPRWS